jgi:hypothetical protein
VGPAAAPEQEPADDVAARPPADPRSRWIGLAVIGAAGVVAIVVTLGIFVPALGEVFGGGSARLADANALPPRILVCGREYTPAATGPGRTLDDVRVLDGREPVVVSAEDDAGCPDEACVEGGLCLPIVYVRTAAGRYIAYALAPDEP